MPWCKCCYHHNISFRICWRGDQIFLGHSKSVYRRHLLAAKKGKENFNDLVNKCISHELITTAMVRKVSKRARGCMLACMALESSNNDVTFNEMTDITHNMIKKMKKVISSHQLDFDQGFSNWIITVER